MEKIFPVLLDRVSDSSDDVSINIWHSGNISYSFVHNVITCHIRHIDGTVDIVLPFTCMRSYLYIISHTLDDGNAFIIRHHFSCRL